MLKENRIQFSEFVAPEGDKVLSEMYTDEQLFEREMDAIFNNTWVWVGHESEIANKGDYKTARVGKHSVIVSRDRKMNIHVLVNRCRHRGATLCEKNKGNARSFVCPYHGWGYGQDGTLRAIPNPDPYEGVINKEDFPLISLRTESYQGMIFATFKEDIEPLEDFLGGAKKWMDLFMKQGGGYPIKTLGSHRFRFPGNWKIQLENTTDAYHFPVIHKSFISSLDGNTAEIFDFLDGDGYVEDLGNGHSVMVMIPDLVDLEEDLDKPIPERFQALADELKKEGRSDEEIKKLVRAAGGSGFNLNLFPNVACSMAFFRVLAPISTNETEIHHVAIGGDGAPAAFNQVRMRLHEHFQGPMGFGTPDDAEAWERVQSGAKNGNDEWILVNRGQVMAEENELGNSYSSVCSEVGMKAAYRQWQKMMRAAETGE
ncbi:Rieske 2Fe-2S domain-containing protein [uncultured Psychrobacter sp.]|uniref:aromatic ring-hydroxylating oxygenase subunit alpha n=1 Tax=uncultured Psychrobacter sp. TaxID=259303 RepID=UPI0034592130